MFVTLAKDILCFYIDFFCKGAIEKSEVNYLVLSMWLLDAGNDFVRPQRLGSNDGIRYSSVAILMF